MPSRVLLFAAIILALWGCGPSQPANPIELHLKLGKNKIESGEYLWYLIEIKNVGRKPVPLAGNFWFTQDSLGSYLDDSSEIRIEVIGPDGDHMGRREMPYGWHVERKFWTNDCGGGTDCESLYRSPLARDHPSKTLAPGETWSPTPSMVAPIRPRWKDVMGDPGDMRALPWFVEDRLAKDPKKFAEEQREWKERVESGGFLYGDPGFRPKGKKPPLELFKGYRILDTYSSNDPGPYRMRFIFVPILNMPLGTPEQIERALRSRSKQWRIVQEGLIFPPGLQPGAFEQIKRRLWSWWEEWPVAQRLKALIKGRYYSLEDETRSCGLPEETRVFRFESDWVEFEVVPAPFPEHMFLPRPGETAKDRALRNYLKRGLRESSLWLEDTPDERERKLRKFREAKENLKHKEALIGAAVEEIRQEKRQRKHPKPSPGPEEEPRKPMTVDEMQKAVEKMLEGGKP